MEKRKETREEEIQGNETGAKKPTTEHLAMEVLKQEQNRNSARNRGLLTGMVILAVVAVASVVAGAFERSHLTDVNYQNDCDWRSLFDSYDFISQDGDGMNYYNSDIGGSVTNGAENKSKEEQENN